MLEWSWRLREAVKTGQWSSREAKCEEIGISLYDIIHTNLLCGEQLSEMWNEEKAGYSMKRIEEVMKRNAIYSCDLQTLRNEKLSS